MKKETKKYVFSVLLLIVLTLFALWFTLKDDHGNVLRILSSLSLLSIMEILGLCLFYYLFIALSLFVITKEKYPHYKFRYAISNAYIGGFFSGITPSASGGQVGQIYVFRKHGVDPSDSAGILWLDFVMYQVVLILYTIVLLLLRFTKFSGEYPALFTIIFIGFLMNSTVLFFLFSMAFFPKKFKAICLFLVKLLSKLHLLKDQKKAMEKSDAVLVAFTENINKNRNNKKLVWKLVLINFLRLSSYFAIPFLIGTILHIKIDFLDSLALSSFVSMANAFFPVPGASGGTEMMFHSLYSLILPQQYVSTVLILWRVVTFHLSLIVGGTLFIIEKFRRRRDL